LSPHYQFQISGKKAGTKGLLWLLPALAIYLGILFLLREPILGKDSIWWWIGFSAINLVFLYGGGLLLAYSFRLFWIRDSYQFIITDEAVTAKSPHPIMGECFHIPLKEIRLLRHLFANQSREGVTRSNDLTYQIISNNEVINLNQYRGHEGKHLFSALRELVPNIPYEQRHASFREVREFNKKYLQTLLKSYLPKKKDAL